MSPNKIISTLTLWAFFASGSLVAQQGQRVRPGAASGPTAVELSIVVLNVIAISDVDESFAVDFAVSMKWRDERLAWGGQSEVLTRTYALEDAWDPTMIIINERNLRAEFPEELEVAPDGAVQYLQRFRGELSATLDLHDFPSDTQRLPIRLAFIGYSPEELRLEFNQEKSALLETAGLSGWAISLAGSSLDPLVVHADKTLASGTFYIAAKRDASYFVLTMMMPLTFIVLMAWMVFWIDPILLPSQIGLSTASVFSLIAYRTALRVALPRVSYMTRADIFILGATVLVFGALAYAVATGRLAKTGREELARRLDRSVRWIYLVLLAATIAVFFLW